MKIKLYRVHYTYLPKSAQHKYRQHASAQVAAETFDAAYSMFKKFAESHPEHEAIKIDCMRTDGDAVLITNMGCTRTDGEPLLITEAK